MQFDQGDVIRGIKATATTTATKTAPLANQRSTLAFVAKRAHWEAVSARAAFDQDATLAIDAFGQVRYCSAGAGALLARSRAQMHLHPVRALIPDLPLKPDTPGYNAAFIAFWFGNGRWRSHEALDGNRRPVPVEISVTPVMIGAERGYVVALRRPARAEVY